MRIALASALTSILLAVPGCGGTSDAQDMTATSPDLAVGTFQCITDPSTIDCTATCTKVLAGFQACAGTLTMSTCVATCQNLNQATPGTVSTFECLAATSNCTDFVECRKQCMSTGGPDMATPNNGEMGASGDMGGDDLGPTVDMTAPCDPKSDSCPLQGAYLCDAKTHTCVAAKSCTSDSDCGNYRCGISINNMTACYISCAFGGFACGTGATCDSTTLECNP